ncbi:hypothetical protein [Larkinella rosea]|uniref:Uncharacterized protein n=1 Tax=Larkinella rosea TaxID=2025312 RepID=A0A3P1BGE5_9BACT|nr:hypothetical protein [Larkinella rosea]RRB00108.1 hypothetical protein EHT25_26150 [Larkinella rosea]
MKRELLTTPLKRIRPVFFNVGENVKRYEQVRGLFVEGHDRLFAEPVITGAGRDEITWYGDYPGDYRTLASYPAEEQQHLLPVLNEQVNFLFRDIIRYVKKGSGQYDRGSYRNLRQSVESFLEVPSTEHILVFNTPQGPRFTLTNWGFTYEQEKPERNIIRKLIPFGVTPVVLQATYRFTNQIAANEPLLVEFEERKRTLTTNENGMATIVDVPYLCEITVYQHDAKGQQVNRQPVFVDERNPAEPYPVLLERLPFPMLFRVVDQRGRTVPRHTVRLDYQGMQLPVQADENGKVNLNGTYYGESVACYDAVDKKIPLVKTHLHERSQVEYLIPVFIPDPLKPIKRGFGCLGLLLLLAALLVAGLVAYYYFAKNEKPISQNQLQNALKRHKRTPRPLSPVMATDTAESAVPDSSAVVEPDTLSESDLEVHDDIPIAQCNGGQDGQSYPSNEIKVITAEYDLGKEGTSFVFDYYTDAVPDQIEVFDGRKADIDDDTKPLFSYYGSTWFDTWSSRPIQQIIKPKSRYVTVRVTGQTIWNYKVNCPSN